MEVDVNLECVEIELMQACVTTPDRLLSPMPQHLSCLSQTLNRLFLIALTNYHILKLQNKGKINQKTSYLNPTDPLASVGTAQKTSVAHVVSVNPL